MPEERELKEQDLLLPTIKWGQRGSLLLSALFWRVPMPVDPWENAFQEKSRRLA